MGYVHAMANPRRIARLGTMLYSACHAMPRLANGIEYADFLLRQ
jgi:hypothetical protein